MSEPKDGTTGGGWDWDAFAPGSGWNDMNVQAPKDGPATPAASPNPWAGEPRSAAPGTTPAPMPDGRDAPPPGSNPWAGKPVTPRAKRVHEPPAGELPPVEQERPTAGPSPTEFEQAVQNTEFAETWDGPAPGKGVSAEDDTVPGSWDVDDLDDERNAPRRPRFRTPDAVSHMITLSVICLGVALVVASIIWHPTADDLPPRQQRATHGSNR